MSWGKLGALDSTRVLERESQQTNNRNYLQLDATGAGFGVTNCGFRGIGLNGDAPHTQLRYFGRRLLSFIFGAAVIDEHVAATPGERERGRAPHAGPATRHDCRVAFDLHGTSW